VKEKMDKYEKKEKSDKPGKEKKDKDQKKDEDAKSKSKKKFMSTVKEVETGDMLHSVIVVISCIITELSKQLKFISNQRQHLSWLILTKCVY